MDEKSLIDLQFDQYSRQSMVFNLVKSAVGNRRIKILDIGGHLGKTEVFFKKDSVIITDLFDVDKKNYVKASALDLPFKENEFDVVVSFDVFEHIAEKDRKKFLEEACRVSSDIVAIAAPFDTLLVAETEKEANRTFKTLFGKNHPWLIEHIDNGLPKLASTEAFFKKKGFSYYSYASNNIFLWKIMMNFYFLCGDSRLSKLSVDLNKFYNNNIKKLGDHTEPSYRKVIFARKNEKNTDLPVFESTIDNATYHEFLEKIFSGLVQVTQDKGLSVEQAAVLREQRNLSVAHSEISSLKFELGAIKNSRAWKIIVRAKQIRSKLLK